MIYILEINQSDNCTYSYTTHLPIECEDGDELLYEIFTRQEEASKNILGTRTPYFENLTPRFSAPLKYPEEFVSFNIYTLESWIEMNKVIWNPQTEYIFKFLKYRKDQEPLEFQIIAKSSKDTFLEAIKIYPDRRFHMIGMEYKN